MRRGAAHPVLPVEPGAVPAHARVERGPRGLRLAPVPAPPGAAPAPAAPPLRLESAAPVPVRSATVVAGGRLALAAAPGVALSLALPRLRVVHDRRPPGLAEAVGAPGANAGLLRADGGWRAVVLPSLGDVLADLGGGPVAIRADGRRVAAAGDGVVTVRDVGSPDPVERHDGAPYALCFTASGALLVAAGASLARPGEPPREGSAIVALAAASGAPRVAALHADGSVSVWEPEGPAMLARWSPPEGAADGAALGIGADGETVTLGAPEGDAPVAWMLRAADGAPVRSVEGARTLAPSPAGDGLLAGGDWGCAWMRPLEDQE